MKKKKNNWFFRVLTLLFIIYVFVFISHKTGYYQKTIRDKTLMTQDALEQFEKDVANNVAVDIKDYLPPEKDYTNIITDSAASLSNTLGNLVENNTKNLWEFIKSLFIG